MGDLAFSDYKVESDRGRYEKRLQKHEEREQKKKRVLERTGVKPRKQKPAAPSSSTGAAGGANSSSANNNAADGSETVGAPGETVQPISCV